MSIAQADPGQKKKKLPEKQMIETVFWGTPKLKEDEEKMWLGSSEEK